VSTVSNAKALQLDTDVGLSIKSEPDSYGSVNSVVATCFDLAAFVSALQELALNAEVMRACTQLVTQQAPKVGTAAHTGGERQSRGRHENDPLVAIQYSATQRLVGQASAPAEGHV